MSYFSLVDNYKDIFTHKPSGKYLHGVTFEEITAFYYFDEELRILFLKYILHVEQYLKSMLAYYFCEKHGTQQSAYLSVKNYNCTPKNLSQINHLITALVNTISLPSHYRYITHYVKTYDNVPLWITVNALTFGQISKMYQYTTSDIRSKISLNFSNISEIHLHQLIRILANCRNICAHNECLYSFQINEAIPDMPSHKELKLPQKNGQYSIGKKDLFAVVIARILPRKYYFPKWDFQQIGKYIKQEHSSIIVSDYFVMLSSFKFIILFFYTSTSIKSFV